MPTLDRQRNLLSGNEGDLVAAIRRGANSRIYTEFRYNEHIDPSSENRGIIQKLSKSCHLSSRRPLDGGNHDATAAGVDTTTVRSTDIFITFMYNQNGLQACALTYLDKQPAVGNPGLSPINSVQMLKYHEHESWDEGTCSPSSNFVYDFEKYRYFVRDEWQDVLSHQEDGIVVSRSLKGLADALHDGAEVKVAFRQLCCELTENPREAMDHEGFIQAGWCYFHTITKQFVAALHPLVRIAPDIPLRYCAKNWDLG